MNAFITCRLCATRFDKGVPAQEGQDDSTFVCDKCAVAGYPQNGWVNPAALRPLEKPEPVKKGFLSRLLGK